jgi:hypothetical protein
VSGTEFWDSSSSSGKALIFEDIIAYTTFITCKSMVLGSTPDGKSGLSNVRQDRGFAGLFLNRDVKSKRLSRIWLNLGDRNFNDVESKSRNLGKFLMKVSTPYHGQLCGIAER